MKNLGVLTWDIDGENTLHIYIEGFLVADIFDFEEQTDTTVKQFIDEFLFDDGLLWESDGCVYVMQ